MTYTLGVDIGTFETKGVLVDMAGEIVAQANRPHEMIVPQPGWAEHRPEEDWWGDFVHVTQAILQESGVDPAQIKAVATSAIGPCMLPVDAAGRPLMNGVLYGVDTRASAEIQELTARIGEDVIFERCGNALTSQSVGPKILWLRRNRPDIWARTAKILTSTSLLTHRLTGRYVIDHYTAANFSPIYDVDRLDWVTDLADDIATPNMLPELMWSNEIAGQVTKQAASVTGLAEGTPVLCGTIDAAAEAISVGVQRPGDMMMMYGSTIFIIQVTAVRVGDPRLWYAPWLFKGQHASMAGLATSGTLTHWFRDQFAQELTREEAFPTLAAEAAESPTGAKGLLMLPYFSGERTPIHDPNAKGAFFGLNLTHTRGDMYRALIEGIAMGTAHVVETFRDVDAAPSRILAVGGGTKNALWLQATSDYAEVPQIVSEKTVGASYGDAFLAACAVGLAKPGDIAVWNPAIDTVSPENHESQAKQYALFKRLYAQTKDIMAEL
ncbi:Carbohydrate kinase, FGGY [Candidatus Rhodobacter oscarellae]|uniref:Carbohydrate kinase, FGGY n=1 Tax=Candidatus Rhodobacter oscarellae TaxID=1675527 RepID=A0A0J9E887_9RHOB|nr:FGGY-family carbohydrate kinase [Candidatus Rhodobacter lobularis]KMW58942.1 Carbohydrate kinase, FGGY [Candidatus Rhodobacter lobularis]